MRKGSGPVVDDLLRSPGLWLSKEQHTGIVISSRVRLARNLQGVPFPGWASEEQREKVCEELRAACVAAPSLPESLYFNMGSLERVDKEVLKERHLISNELAEQGRGSGLILAAQEKIAVMINEEDHLRLQAIRPGLNLRTVWEKINAVDSELEERVPLAFSPSLGYLTACPTNVGTGLRASVMVHLSGLRLTEEIDAVVKGLDKLGLVVRGLLGEGTEAYGNMFQISNQGTLGQTEPEIIDWLTKVAEEVTLHEQNARSRLAESRRSYLLDYVGRAFGNLMYARLLSSKEAVDLLSGLRLGVELEMVKGLTIGKINEIMLLTQPGHLQKISERTLDPAERDEVRARVVRQKLGKVSLAA